MVCGSESLGQSPGAAGLEVSAAFSAPGQAQPLLTPAVLGGPGPLRGAALSQCPLFPLMSLDKLLNPVAFLFLNSGILAGLPVAMDLPGDGLVPFNASTAQP